MPGSTIVFEPGSWGDLKERVMNKDPKLESLMGLDSPHLNLMVLDKGMTSGKPSVSIRLDLPEGRTLVFETSARILCVAAQAILARYPDLFVDNDNAAHPTQTSH